MLTQRGLWLFLVPSFTLLSVVLVWPLGYALYISLFDYFLGDGIATFVGLNNYIELLSDERLWNSLLTTIGLGFSAVALELALGFALALGIYKLTHSAQVFTVLLFLPHIITPVVSALFLKWLFSANWGLIDATLLTLDIVPPDWLGDRNWARFTVVLADAWLFTPFVMIMLYAARQTLDSAILEAAEIDGANPMQTLWHVTIPALVPVIVFTVSIRLMDVFRYFDTIYVLTGGGPGTATETITMYTYQLGFRMLEVGKASALGVITLVVVGSLVATLSFVVNRRFRGAQ
jgi:multiple sugar transport system permease protein